MRLRDKLREIEWWNKTVWIKRVNFYNSDDELEEIMKIWNEVDIPLIIWINMLIFTSGRRVIIKIAFQNKWQLTFVT